MKTVILAYKRLVVYFILKYFPYGEKWRIQNKLFKVSQLNEKTGKLKIKGYFYLD
jgi:hypothetical protein